MTSSNRHPNLLVLFIATVVMALAVPSIAAAASVTPTQVSGNPSCSDLDSGWTEFKIDKLPTNGTYTGGGFTVTISNAQNGKTFDWSDASQGVDAVLVKAGTETYVYAYSPEATGDTNMGSPGEWAISHVSFCFDGSDSPPPPNPCGTSDMDGDGVGDSCDNCGTVVNPGQEDTDHDGMGDACEPTPTPQTCDQLHAGEADTDSDGKVDACDNCPTVMNPGQEDTDHNNVGDACTSVNEQVIAGEQQQSAPAPAQPVQNGQIVLGERISAPTARLIAASGCASRAFTAGVRGTGIARVVFTVDGKRVRTVTKKNAHGLFAVRINPSKYRIGVHRIVVNVTFQPNRRTAARSLRASFQRCGKRLVAPRFTG